MRVTSRDGNRDDYQDKGKMRTGEELQFLYMHIRATAVKIDLAVERQWLDCHPSCHIRSINLSEKIKRRMHILFITHLISSLANHIDTYIRLSKMIIDFFTPNHLILISYGLSRIEVPELWPMFEIHGFMQ